MSTESREPSEGENDMWADYSPKWDKPYLVDRENMKKAQQEIEGMFLSLIEEIESSHREGHCEHYGDCEKVRSVYEFLTSPEGKESFEDFIYWMDEEIPAKVYDKMFGRGFVPKDWIDEKELSAYLEGVVQ